MKERSVEDIVATFRSGGCGMVCDRQKAADEIERLRRELADMSVINSIDDKFGSRLAWMLECLIVDYHGHWEAACKLLDEYKAEWEKINPSPPTFMGEPIPQERALGEQHDD